MELRLACASAVGVRRQGDIVVFNNPMPADTSLSIDRRELYISRCIGTPGDTLMLNNQLIAEGTDVFSPDTKALYSYPADSEEVMDSVLHSLGITDNQLRTISLQDILRKVIISGVSAITNIISSHKGLTER